MWSVAEISKKFMNTEQNFNRSSFEDLEKKQNEGKEEFINSAHEEALADNVEFDKAKSIEDARATIEELTQGELKTPVDVLGEFDYQTYRDDLAQRLLRLRSIEDGGRENAKIVLENAKKLPEYSDAMELHGQERKEKINEADQKKKEELNAIKVEQMKKIVEELPFDYISIPVRPNNQAEAVLLRIKKSDYAFLVGNNLEKCGSNYGIRTNGEKIFMLCGCTACNNFNEDFEVSLREVAKENGISQVITRLKDYDIYIEVGNFKLYNETLSPDLAKDELLPTTMPSDKEIAKMEKKQAEHAAKYTEEKKKYMKIEEMNKALLQEASLLGVDEIKTEEGASRLKKIIGKMSESVIFDIDSAVDERILGSKGEELRPEVKDILKKIKDFNILTISKHENLEKSYFHLPTTAEKISLKQDQSGELIFDFDNGLRPGRQTYRIASVRPGLDMSDIVLIAIPNESDKYDGRNGGTLELYTDLPYHKIFDTPIEYEIISQKIDEAKSPNSKIIYKVDDLDIFQQTMRERAKEAMKAASQRKMWAK